MSRRNPNDPSSYNHRKVLLSTGRTYHFVDEFAGPEGSFDPLKTPTLICIHGFPDLWFGWRHQIGPWVDNGWRVVVPDMIGYGDTDKPEDLRFYTSKSLCADIAALLDFIDVPKAVIIGHDWGSQTAWRFAGWYPERCKAVVNLSIPYDPPRDTYRSLEDSVKIFPSYAYQLYLADPKSTAAIERNLNVFFAAIYQTPTSGYRRLVLDGIAIQGYLRNETGVSWHKSWNDELTSADVRYYLDTFSRGGMTGPLNYYRTTKLRYEEEKESNLSAELPKHIPWLFVYGAIDPTSSPNLRANMKRYVPQLEVVAVKGTGHWIMIEAKAAVTESVIDFIKRNVVDERTKL